MNTPQGTQYMSQLPFRKKDLWYMLVASMEQMIGASLSAVVGVMIPMMQMLMPHPMAAWEQGLTGAMGLIGIAVGSTFIGSISDKAGYLGLFRLCPLIILGGAALCLVAPHILGGIAGPWCVPLVLAGLFICGLGVGGGYSLDSSYISELMPERWRSVLVGSAKATSAVGFILGALISFLIIHSHPYATAWALLMYIIGAAALLTFLMRLKWAQSPLWLIMKGKDAAAQDAVHEFFGPNVDVKPPQRPACHKDKAVRFDDLFHGQNLLKVIFSGIPWACEGLGVYGFGVFLPVFVMSLGISHPTKDHIIQVMNSVEITALVNCFILVGFVIGLFIMHRFNLVKMMTVGFAGSAVGLGLLLCAHVWHWPAWVMILGFIVFELFLNGGPHLLTYIIPTRIFPICERGAGSGIAVMLGKAGAIVGVIVMPLLLHHGGITLVLAVSIAVMLLGGFIGLFFGRILGYLSNPL